MASLRNWSEIWMSELRNEIKLETAGSDSFQLEAFARVFARHLEDSEQIFDLNVELLSCKGPRGKRLELLGYAEDSTDQTLTILTGKYFGNDSTLTLTDAKEIFSRAEGFIEHSLDGLLSKSLELSSREAEYSAYFFGQHAKARIAKIRVVLITDGFMSERIKTLESGSLSGLKVTYEIWDQKRLIDAELPEAGSEDIRVDFTKWLPQGLPCLVATTEDSSTETYLAVIPAKVLAEIFDEYGSLLLESNVRTFLSARGAVNKGIQATLAQEPNRFLAYNNGLTTTATNVELGVTASGPTITSVDRWQIVNGGQTTASIVHYLRGDRSRNVENVHVQMKLVKVTDSDSSSVVQAVAKYANSQNRVNAADLFATHEFHVRLEQISRRLRAPAKEGQQYQTGWYYERARGQWEYEKVSRASGAERAKFELEYPRSQKLTKTDWAKYSYCWGKKPHLVSKGAQSVFADYAVAVDKQWEAGDAAFNENYFKTNVSKAILYEQLRTSVLKQEWYTSSQGYLANIVAYAIAKFSLEIGRQLPSERYDFNKIWNLQAVPAPTLRALLGIAQQAQRYLTDDQRPQANVTQWAKQPACWDGFSKVAFTLDSEVGDDLMDLEESAAIDKDAKQARKMDSGFEAIERIHKVKPAVWTSVLSSVSSSPLSPMESDLVREFGTERGKVPSDRQAEALLRMLGRFVSLGIISGEDY